MCFICDFFSRKNPKKPLTKTQKAKVKQDCAAFGIPTYNVIDGEKVQKKYWYDNGRKGSPPTPSGW